MAFFKKVKGEGKYELIWVNVKGVGGYYVDTYDIMDVEDKDILSIAKKIARRKK